MFLHIFKYHTFNYTHDYARNKILHWHGVSVIEFVTANLYSNAKCTGQLNVAGCSYVNPARAMDTYTMANYANAP